MKHFNYQSAVLNQSTSIEASAGTGKTYTIEHLILRLLTETVKTAPLSLEEILVVTFTEKATREMKERIRFLLQNKLYQDDTKEELDLSNLQKNLIRKALTNFNQSAIYTIHSFCQRTLKEFSFKTHSPLVINHESNLEFIIDAIWRLLREKHINEKEYRLLQIAFDLKTHQEIIDFLFHSYQKKLFDENNSILLPNQHQENWSMEYFLKQINVTHPLQSSLNQWVNCLKELTLKEFILDFSHLNGNSYKKNKQSQYFNELNAFNYLTQCEDYFQLIEALKTTSFQNLRKFTRSEIEKKLLKKSTYADLLQGSLYDKLESLFNTLDANLKMTLQQGVHLLKRSLNKLKKHVDAQRKELGIQTFENQILDLEQALIQYPSLSQSLKNKYKVVLIDEFQDTDPHQWNIFKHAFLDQHTPIFLIGDPKQSIYAFRDANLNTYFKAKNHKQIIHHQALTINYRSSEYLIHGFNLLFSRLFKNTKLNYLDAQPPTISTHKASLPHPISFYFLNKEDEKIQTKEIQNRNVNFIINEIKNLNTNHPEIPLNEIAILTSQNKEAKLFHQTLNQIGIPSTLSSQTNVWHTSEASDILILLEAIQSPNSSSKVLSIFYTLFFQLKNHHIVEIKNNYLFYFQKQLINWKSLIEENKIIKVKEELFNLSFSQADIKLSPYQQRQLSQLGGERRITNIEHIFELLNRFQNKNNTSIDEVINYMKTEQIQQSENEDNLIRLETEKESIQILTMHASKGLEFSVVFLHTGLSHFNQSQNKYYQYFEENKKVFDFNKSQANKDKEKDFELNELYRLFYVATTRAKNRIYLPIVNVPITGMKLKSLPLVQIWEKILENAPSQDNVSKLLANTSIFKQIHFIKSSHHININNETKGISLIPPKKPNWQHHSNAYPKVTSFSQLEKSLSKQDDMLTDFLEHDVNLNTSFQIKEEENIYTFSKGAKLGNLFHLIFESIPFNDFTTIANINEFIESPISTTIDEIIKDFFDPSWSLKYSLYVKTIIWNTLKTKFDINGDSFSLSMLKDQDKIHEIEFLLPIKQSTLTFSSFKDTWIIDKNGYLKGFIDLLFKFKGKYYLADWKSNSLGRNSSYYQTNHLTKAMDENHYQWQSLFYTIAICKQLSLQEKFNYEEHFGGVCYFFIRGMSPINDFPNQGIYFNTFSSKELEKFSNSILTKPFSF